MTVRRILSVRLNIEQNPSQSFSLSVKVGGGSVSSGSGESLANDSVLRMEQSKYTFHLVKNIYVNDTNQFYAARIHFFSNHET